MDTEAQILLLQMQNDELFAKLDREEEAHRRASARATAAERQNCSLRKKIEYAESEIAMLEQCWNCADIGNKEICSKCTNNAIFSEIDGRCQWRGYPKTQRR